MTVAVLSIIASDGLHLSQEMPVSQLLVDFHYCAAPHSPIVSFQSFFSLWGKPPGVVATALVPLARPKLSLMWGWQFHDETNSVVSCGIIVCDVAVWAGLGVRGTQRRCH